MVPWLRQRLASFEDASLQGMAGKKKLGRRGHLKSFALGKVPAKSKRHEACRAIHFGKYTQSHIHKFEYTLHRFVGRGWM